MGCTLLKFDFAQVALKHLGSHVTANPVQHRLFPGEGFRAAVLMTIPAVTVKLSHDCWHVKVKPIPVADVDIGQEISKVRRKSVTFNQALPHAFSDTRFDLGVRQFSNGVDPE